MRLVLVCVVLSLAVSWTCTAIGQPQPAPGDQPKDEDAIGFEVFAGFKRIEKGNPILALASNRRCGRPRHTLSSSMTRYTTSGASATTADAG
jgi:hypothetical protein